TGGCTGVAGHSSSTPVGFRYGPTPPYRTSVSGRRTGGENIGPWKTAGPDDVVAITRVARGSKSERSLFSGAGASFVDKKIQDGFEYRYSVRTYDQAGNFSPVRKVLALPKVVSLGNIGYTPRSAAQPILSW